MGKREREIIFKIELVDDAMDRYRRDFRMGGR